MKWHLLLFLSSSLIFLYFEDTDATNRDDNGAGFFGYPPRPSPNGTGLNFIKRVWDGFENSLKNPERVRGGGGYCPTPPRPALIFHHTFALELFHRSGYGSFLSPETKELLLHFQDSPERTRREEPEGEAGQSRLWYCQIQQSEIWSRRHCGSTRRRGGGWRYPRRSDRGGTTTVREGGAATGVTHGNLITAALR